MSTDGLPKSSTLEVKDFSTAGGDRGTHGRGRQRDEPEKKRDLSATPD
jgi:hypothetical protein